MSILKIIEKKVPIDVWFYECEIQNVDKNYFIEKIENNISKDNSYATNVKGGMTDWNLFNNDLNFHNLLLESQNVLGNNRKVGIRNSWGIKVGKDEYTEIHNHFPAWASGIYYLTDSDTPLNFPDIEIDVKPKSGTFVIWSGVLNHKTERLKNGPKYAIAFNLDNVNQWDKRKIISNE